MDQLADFVSTEMSIPPVAGHLGAVVTGVDLTEAPEPVLGQVWAAMLRHKVLFFTEIRDAYRAYAAGRAPDLSRPLRRLPSRCAPGM